MRKIGILIFFLALSRVAFAQYSLIPLNEDLYHQIDRLVMEQEPGDYGFQGTVKPYSRQQVLSVLREMKNPSGSFANNWRFLARDSWEGMDSLELVERKPLAKYFFTSRTDFFSTQKPAFDVHVNPVIDLTGGYSPGDTSLLFRNTRGIEVRGTIDGKVSFYTIMADNQARWAPYVRDAIDSIMLVPGQGFWKPFQGNGVDFFLARGHVAVPVSKHIELSMGHDRHFVGHGYRSMIWSDFAPPALYFRADTRVWRVRYTNLFTQMVAGVNTTPGGTLGGQPFTTKQVVFHHLSVNLAPNFQGGVFELVLNGDADSLNSRFGLNYLNPIIFYRAIEQQGGSSGNVLLGMDFKWDLWGRLRLYGQFVLDEFLLSEVQAQRGWWGNKYGAQLGAKYTEAFEVPGLDLQAEVNWARPFTYTHLSDFTSVTHYGQPLAHPLGANFREAVFLLRYQPSAKWQISAKGIGALYGADTAGSNWGTNITLPYTTRQLQFGNEIGQGVPVVWGMGELRVNYELWHQCYMEARGLYRYQKVGEEPANGQLYTSLGLRWALPYRPQDF